MCKPKTLAVTSLKNASFESSSHYEDINVTSKEYAMNGIGGGGIDCSCSDGGGGVRRIKYPKVLPDFPGGAAERRLSLPPPMAGIPEGSGKIPPPPPPRVSSTLGRKKDVCITVAGGGPSYNRLPQLQHDAIPEEHKSLVVPCVPNKVCPEVRVAAASTTTVTVKKPAEPRIVIKANSVQQHTQQQQHQQQQHQQKQPKRTNIPRVIHPQNSDRNNKTAAAAAAAGTEGDTGTIKRKKK